MLLRATVLVVIIIALSSRVAAVSAQADSSDVPPATATLTGHVWPHNARLVLEVHQENSGWLPMMGAPERAPTGQMTIDAATGEFTITGIPLTYAARGLDLRAWGAGCRQETVRLRFDGTTFAPATIRLWPEWLIVLLDLCIAAAIVWCGAWLGMWPDLKLKRRTQLLMGFAAPISMALKSLLTRVGAAEVILIGVGLVILTLVVFAVRTLVLLAIALMGGNTRPGPPPLARPVEGDSFS